MKNWLLLFLLCYFGFAVHAQYSTVIFDYEKSTFNGNLPLPAESNMMFTGATSPQINMIEVLIYRAAGKSEKSPLYSSVWKRPYGNNSEVFHLPINYKLRGGQDYDLEIRYFRNLTNLEKEILMRDLYSLLDAYIDMTYQLNKNKISISKQYGSIIKDLNSIVESGLELYRNRNEFEFRGFSDMVKLKLKYLEGINLNKAEIIYTGKEEKADKKNKLRNKQLEELKEILHKETKQYLNNELLVIIDVKKVFDYPVEKTRNVISINAGYAASFFDFKFSDLDYGSTPYVGFSVPFGNKAFKSSFLSNTSISIGIFILDMEDNAGNNVTGPFISKPFYAGLGYKVFKFIRLNAGAVLLEKELPDSEKVFVRPFVGASIDFNFWLGLGDKDK